jgi:hypothetical protein
MLHKKYIYIYTHTHTHTHKVICDGIERVNATKFIVVYGCYVVIVVIVIGLLDCWIFLDVFQDAPCILLFHTKAYTES